MQASFSHASPRAVERARIALDSHNLSGRSNQSGHQHRHISYAGAHIQDTLPWTNACLAEESFGERCDTRSLSD
jgi:hypothetical protein